MLNDVIAVTNRKLSHRSGNFKRKRFIRNRVCKTGRRGV